MQYWFLGSPFCKAYVMMPNLRRNVISVTVLFIAIERYLVIVHRSDKPRSPAVVEIVSLIIWITGILVSVHWVIYSDVRIRNDIAYSCERNCDLSYFIFSWIFEIVRLPISASIELFVYIRIYCAMSKYALHVGPSTLISAKRTVRCAIFISAFSFLRCSSFILGHWYNLLKIIIEIPLSVALPVIYGYMDFGIRQAYFIQLRYCKRKPQQTAESENIAVPDSSRDQNASTVV